MDAAEIPDAARDDAIMAAPAERAHVSAWISESFLGQQADSGARVRLEVRRQDYNVLQYGRSCMETPITIGDRAFEHGLGTHANSEIMVYVPEGARQFRAWAGIDNNYDTQGRHGSAVFSVEADGAELARTPVLHGGEGPVEVAVDIPAGTKELVLRVDTTPDGPGHDQADWADAALIMDDGATVWLDEGQHDRLLAMDKTPFSFVYGGTSSADALASWPKEHTAADTADWVEHTIRWRDPETGLVVTADVRDFKRFGAVDWVLRFENTGTQDTPLIEDVQALDAELRTGNSKNAATFRRNLGDSCAEQSFANAASAVNSGEEIRMAPVGGRPSNGAFPFFDITYGGDTLITAVGWSGQWAVSFQRSQAGPGRLRAGMELTHLRLKPGEAIRTPRILLMPSQADYETVHNRFRRLVLFHYAPKLDGRPVAPPVALQCFDRYSWSGAHPEWATEQGQIHAARVAHSLGFDSLWLDAAWFPGGFPNGVGNWFPKPAEFPNGLGPVSRVCRENGMKFILWFEPERVAKGTFIATEHPDFVFGGAEGGLFKLNDPEAREWLTETLSKQIVDGGVDVYRNDFNIDPLPFWRGNDAEDRQGMTEIRYVEGLYAMWDELLRRHPGLMIDNCASGGRRIDLEMCSRSVPLWRSDTNCSPGHADWNQAHSLGIGVYVPLHTACAWTPDAYEVLSTATSGLICQWDYLNPEFPEDEARASLAEARRLQKYWYGDVYPLAIPAGSDGWAAYQLHRADLNEGVVLAFRRKDSPYTGMAVALKALDAEQAYEVVFSGDGPTAAPERHLGKDLMAETEIRLSQRRGYSVMIYKGATQ